jgi:hypothetical protein
MRELLNAVRARIAEYRRARITHPQCCIRPSELIWGAIDSAAGSRSRHPIKSGPPAAHTRARELAKACGSAWIKRQWLLKLRC